MDGCAGGGRLREQGVKIVKFFLEFAEQACVYFGRGVVDSQGELRFLVPEFGFEDLPCAGNGVALVVEKAFNAKGHLDIAAAIETLTGTALVRFELREFALPEAQDVGGDIAEFGYFADAEVELVRDVGSGCGGCFADWLMLRHAQKLRCGYAGGGGLRSGLCQYRPRNPAWFVIFMGRGVWRRMLFPLVFGGRIFG
jgi:hypothetical protein